MRERACTGEGEAGEDEAGGRPAEEFQVGDVVRLVGLRKAEYNHHMGRVVSVGDQCGRVGVALHGVLWTAAGERRTDGDGDEPPAFRRRVQCGSGDAPISLKPANLRRVQLPEERPPATTMVGCLPAAAIEGLLGQRGLGIPDAAAQRVADFLTIEWMDPAELSVTTCSSTRGDFPLKCVLDSSEGDWWISGNNLADGVGSEYLEFSVGATVRRVSFLALSIPPLPHGPLSVRDFHVLALLPGASGTEEDDWVAASPNPMHTLDKPGLQEFALVPPAETRALRLVCTRTAAAGNLLERYTGMVSCIGLFQVRFA